jgi:hypothetical protein
LQHLSRKLSDEVTFFHGHDRATDLISIQGLSRPHLAPHQSQRLSFHCAPVDGEHGFDQSGLT